MSLIKQFLYDLMYAETMKKQSISKGGDTWEWEETPEVVESLKKLNKPKFAGNYPGPLYAPHPRIKQDKNEGSYTPEHVRLQLEEELRALMKQMDN